jgi:hypothetical protein
MSAMSTQNDSNASARTWRNLFFGLLFVTSVFLLYDFAAAAGNVSSMRSRLFGTIPADVENIGPSVIQHGIDARLVWSKGSVPPTRLLRHAPGM